MKKKVPDESRQPAPGKRFFCTSGPERLRSALGISAHGMNSFAALVLVARVTNAATALGADKDFTIVDTPAYEGAIVPAEEAARDRYLAKHYKAFWAPTTNEIAKAEASLTAFINGSTNEYAADIRKKLKSFVRQYVGYTAHGEKRILCNFLPTWGRWDIGGDWVHFFLKGFDVGPDFWQIHYRVEKDECDHFRVESGF
jgi:hypothetical protein